MDGNERLARRLRLWVRLLSVAAIAAVVAFALYTPRPKPEQVRPVIAVSRPAAVSAAAEAAPAPREKTRRDGVYTLLLAGLDDGNGNTDTIMLVRLDGSARRLDVVSIPRDTMVNTTWNVRKLNAAYSVGMLSGEGGGACLRREAARLTGFEADYYAVVNLRVFEQVIDTLGGVDFEVPMAMDYEDAEQGLRIHLRPGWQHLNGAQALGLCRFRSGYPSADLGRIDMQQRFLHACAEQFLTLGNIPHFARVAALLAENLETDMSAGSIVWFLRQALRVPAENLHFATAPCEADTVRGVSYTILRLEGWLGLLNESLNPYTAPIAAEELDLIYVQDGVLGYTVELRAPVSAEPEPAVAAMEPEKPTIIVVNTGKEAKG